VGGEHLVDRTEGATAKFAGDRVGASGVGIDNSDESNFARLLKCVIDASVIASEGADADDGYIDRGVTQMKAPTKITGYCRRLRAEWGRRNLQREFKSQIAELSYGLRASSHEQSNA
jgi:hypothetical protein